MRGAGARGPVALALLLAFLPTGPGFAEERPVGRNIADPAAAQSCPPQVTLSVGSDPTVHRCNLDPRPTHLEVGEGVPEPRYSRAASVTLTVVVSPDGRVDPERTRPRALSGDREFLESTLGAVHAMRAGVGMLEGAPTRYGFELVVQVEPRSETFPEVLQWRLVAGELADTLVGSWHPDPDPVDLPPDTDLAVADAVTRALDAAGLFPVGPMGGRGRCLVLDEPSGRVQQAVARALDPGAPFVLAVATPESAGCALDPGTPRLRLGRAVHTGRGRMVLEAAGDRLPAWPPGFQARAWTAWQARCVAWIGPDGALEPARCDVRPAPGAVSYDGAGADGMFDGPPQRGSALRLALEVRAGEAVSTDTLRATLDRVPRLGEVAVLDPGEAMCRNRNTWQVTAPQAGVGGRVVWIAFPGLGSHPARVNLLDVRPERDDPFPGLNCPEEDRFRSPYALGVLPAPGDPPAGPVQVCLNEPGCTRRHVVDPEEHRIAPAPAVHVRVSELRETSRGEGVVQMRLRTDRPVEGALVFAVLSGEGRDRIFPFRPLDALSFDFSLAGGHGLTDDLEIFVYLLSVPAWMLEPEAEPGTETP